MLVVDIETTGLDPALHGILSVGAVDFDRPERIFYGECRLDKGKIADPAALEYNGFTIEQINDSTKPSQNELIKKFAQWAEAASDKTIAGENPANLDLPLLRPVFAAAQLVWPFGYRSIDLHSVSYCHHIGTGKAVKLVNGLSSLSLDETLKYVGLQPEPKPHHGLTGAKLEAEAFGRLLLGKNLLTEYKSFALPAHLKK